MSVSPQEAARELLKRRRRRQAVAAEPWRQWCPQEPLPKQEEFLRLNCREAFYGGAAGPGKSSSLLMAALQYVHVPRYAALLFRRDFSRLALPGALMDRAKEWFIPRGVKWSADEKTFRFPSGATITFGYLDNFNDRYRYQSSEFQFIGFDELTEFPEDAYTFMFSRNRQTKDVGVPLRFRAASNPGGVGHDWVLRRFISKEAIEATSRGEFGVFWQEGRAFVPGRLIDNPYVDAAEYRESLMHMDPVSRERLLNGDWSVREDSRIKPDWMRYYTNSGDYYSLARTDGREFSLVHPRDCFRFTTIDTAGTSAEKAKESKGKPHSWSVITTWDFVRRLGLLVMFNMRRGRWEFPELCVNTERAIAEDRPTRTFIENAHNGPALHQTMRAKNVPSTELCSHEGTDKLTRAQPFLNMCAEGRVYLPKEKPWVETVQSEYFAWTGHPDEPADIIDTSSYAGRYASLNAPQNPTSRPVFLKR